MNSRLDATHDPSRRSWVESANDGQTDFPIQNLPFGAFRVDEDVIPRAGVAIGDQILDLAACDELGLFARDARMAVRAVAAGTLNGLLALGRGHARELRHQISDILEKDSEAARHAGRILRSQDAVESVLPISVGDYTDFYASVHHATNVGSMFRPDNPLLPNYKWIPVGYHGRASSIIASGEELRRPWGQTVSGEEVEPTYRPSSLLDYELEMGFYVCQSHALGERIALADAEQRIFGLSLVNDWSARDLQKWEYQPLGPFLAKSFATTVSPWVVTLDALEPFRCPAFERPEGDPQPLPHLESTENRQRGGLDLQLEVFLSTARMREEGVEPQRLSRGNFREMYWTMAQMLTHHASNGCNLRAGDLLASGTVSGPDKENRGCLLELTWRGSEPVQLPGGEERRFLEDGDEIILRGRCEAEGAVALGFGECRGRILPALETEKK
jgi:fumarylacetoacetase